jgi:hypothetical protein
MRASIACFECSDTAADVSAAFLAGRQSRVCFCVVSDEFEAMDRFARSRQYADEDYELERRDRRVDMEMGR